jgi:hypothetical protein
MGDRFLNNKLHSRHDDVRRTSWLWEFRPGLHIIRALGLVHKSRLLKEATNNIKSHLIDAG